MWLFMIHLSPLSSVFAITPSAPSNPHTLARVEPALEWTAFVRAQCSVAICVMATSTRSQPAAAAAYHAAKLRVPRRCWLRAHAWATQAHISIQLRRHTHAGTHTVTTSLGHRGPCQSSPTLHRRIHKLAASPPPCPRLHTPATPAAVGSSPPHGPAPSACHC
jgi:hypothetical protein